MIDEPWFWNWAFYTILTRAKVSVKREEIADVAKEDTIIKAPNFLEQTRCNKKERKKEK